MKAQYAITVFTPTYNRERLLPVLFASLQRQTFTDFEWLVIDDGSADQTEKLFSQWQQKELSFPIRYLKTENGGKCRAINTALDIALGRMFFIVDSDDYITDDALEKIIQWEKELPTNLCFCGVAGNMGTSSRYSPNSILPVPYEGTLLDRYGIVDGERALVFYTDVFRKYQYPVFSNEKFMTEGIAYNRMAHDGYRMRFYNDIIVVYEYREDGLTQSGFRLFAENPHGYGLWLKEKSVFMHDSLLQKIKLIYSFTCDLKEYYHDEVIADCLHTSRFFVSVARRIGELKAIFNKKQR